MDAIRFYCGTSHKYWSYHLADPGPYACISPVFGRGKASTINTVHVPPGTQVLQDSGAYCEPFSRPASRLTFSDALTRQEKHAEKYDYADRIVYRASYDLLIDHRAEASPGSARRTILRCSESDGVEAIVITVQAARFLAQHRNGYPLALNVQGVTPAQYLSCVKQIVPMLKDGDILGLGGWCILGRVPSMMDDFLLTLDLVIPFLAREGVPRIHVYGCIYTPALAALLAICDHFGIALSTDSAFPGFGPRIGKWGYGIWRNKWYRRPKVLSSCYTKTCASETRCVGLECIRHVKLTRAWLSDFRERESQLYCLYARNLDQYEYGRIIDLEDG